MHLAQAFICASSPVSSELAAAMAQLSVGDRVSHYKTGRTGIICYLYVSGKKAVILFDDGKEECRWIRAFVRAQHVNHYA